LSVAHKQHGGYKVNDEIDRRALGFDPNNLLALCDSAVMYVPNLREKSPNNISMMRVFYRRKLGVEAEGRITEKREREIIQRFMSGRNGFGHMQQREDAPS